MPVVGLGPQHRVRAGIDHVLFEVDRQPGFVGALLDSFPRQPPAGLDPESHVGALLAQTPELKVPLPGGVRGEGHGPPAAKVVDGDDSRGSPFAFYFGVDGQRGGPRLGAQRPVAAGQCGKLMFGLPVRRSEEFPNA